MQTWKCGDKDCSHNVVGLGAPHGLRAIGWYVHTPAPAYTGYVMQQQPVTKTTAEDAIIRCPYHNPEGAERAERAARRFQGGLDLGGVFGTVADFFGDGGRRGGDG